MEGTTLEPSRRESRGLAATAGSAHRATVQSYLRIIAIAFGLAVALGLSLVAFGEGGKRYQLQQIRNEVFTLEIAATDKARKQGLRGRASLASDGGMLIQVDQPEILTYSTRYTPFPLDVLYVDAGGTVVQIDHLQANDERLTASTSRQPVSGAVLLLGGTVRRLHLTCGESLAFVRPRRRADPE
jgi:uncharacterized protein